MSNLCCTCAKRNRDVTSCYRLMGIINFLSPSARDVVFGNVCPVSRRISDPKNYT